MKNIENSAMVKILNVGQNYAIRGGSDRALINQGELLSSDGFDVIPFATLYDDEFVTEWVKYSPKRVDFDKPGFFDVVRYIYSVSAKKAIKTLLSETTIDLAHLHIYYGQLTTSILKPLKNKGVPIVQTLHDYKLICPVATLYTNGVVCEDCIGGRFYNCVIGRCNRGRLSRSVFSTIESYFSRMNGAVNDVDHFITVSDFQRRKLIEHGIPQSKLTTVHNFIDAEKIKTSNSEGGYFLYYGRIEEYKGIKTLLKSAAYLKNNAKVYFVGDGEYLEKAQSWAEQSGLSNVSFLGFKNDSELEKLINESICTITPSLCYETFGLTLIESFARGKPVIVSEIGGMTEIVEHGCDGFLFEPGNHVQLAEFMSWMLDNPRNSVKMGMMGRNKVLKKFSPAAHLEKIKNVYRHLGVKC